MINTRLRSMSVRTMRERGDEGIAMMLVLMVMMIVASLSVLMLGVVVSQVNPTLFTKKETATITAAEAGVDTTLGQLRNALTLDTSQSPAVVIGDQSQLPCSNTGTSTTESGTLSYSVSVQYFQADPTGHDSAWRDANDLVCTDGSGTTNIAGVSTVPLFAYVRSAGAGSALPGKAANVGNRTVESIYDFSVTDANIKGGLIRLGLSSPELCMKASARAGTAYLVVATCDESDPLQKWAYQTDLTIRLAVNVNSGTELCIDSTNAAAVAVNLRGCDLTAAGQARQRWSFNDTGHLEGPNMVTQNVNTWCIVVNPADTVHNNVTLWQAQSCGPIESSNGTWNLDATVGAGAAGTQDGSVPTGGGQLVNYAKFGRCFDVTGQTMSSDHMIGYPCKQAINPANVAWNQRLKYDSVSGHLYTANGADERCVTAPSTPGSTAWVLMVACSPGNIASQRWTLMGSTSGDRDIDYTVRSGLGTPAAPMCMTLEDNYPASVSATSNMRYWGGITLENCSGSLRQKWNAPPFPKDSKQHDTAERAH